MVFDGIIIDGILIIVDDILIDSIIVVSDIDNIIFVKDVFGKINFDKLWSVGWFFWYKGKVGMGF